MLVAPTTPLHSTGDPLNMSSFQGGERYTQLKPQISDLPLQGGTMDFSTTTTTPPVEDEGVSTSSSPSRRANQTTNEQFPAVPTVNSTSIVVNFCLLSVLFSANHGCVVSCLAVATARLGATVGAWQSGVLYITYTASSLLGATQICHWLGARNALMAGMGAYVVYVGCFWVATQWPTVRAVSALAGAVTGGMGAGFLWTAQGAYFVQAAREHEQATQLEHGSTSLVEGSSSTSLLAGIFAFVYLFLELLLRSLSTAMLEHGLPWSTVFGTYTVVAIVSAALMVFTRNHTDSSPAQSIPHRSTSGGTAQTEDVSTSSHSPHHRRWVTWYLLRHDPKMKYMAGLNVVFGWAASFLNSYVNGQVVPVVFQNDSTIGLWTSWVSVVAALGSLGFARLSPWLGSVPILMLGSACFAGVALPFLVVPQTSRWNSSLLLLVYTFHGIGRATFEGTLKATFADMFGYEKEGAFANIILQNGLASSVGYVLSVRLGCAQESPYCVQYRDGSLHNVLSFELLIVGTAVLAIAGLWRARRLYGMEQILPSQTAAHDQTSPLVSVTVPETSSRIA